MGYINFNLKDTINLIGGEVDVIGSGKLVAAAGQLSEPHGPSPEPSRCFVRVRDGPSRAPRALARTRAHARTCTRPQARSLRLVETPSLFHVLCPCTIGPPALVSKTAVEPPTARGSASRRWHNDPSGLPAERVAGAPGGPSLPSHTTAVPAQRRPVLFQEDDFAGFFFFFYSFKK